MRLCISDRNNKMNNIKTNIKTTILSGQYYLFYNVLYKSISESHP